MVNPYEAPQRGHSTRPDGTHRVSNRARPLLYLIGGVCVVAAIPMIVAGVSRGPTAMLYASTTLAFGVSGLWVGYRSYDSLTRVGTVLWGLVAITVVLATGIRPPLHLFTLLVIGLQLLAVAAVPIIALRQPPAIGEPNRVRSSIRSSDDD